MATLFGGPKPEKVPAAPQIDDAALLRNQRDRALRAGQGTTILTSDKGLPDLGSTTKPAAGGG
jgi:hypothetical protein